MLKRLAFLRSIAAAALLLGGPVACFPSGDIQLCGEIPEGGCPAGRGGSCTDEVCAGLYDCVDGAWTEVQRCDEFVPGGGGGGGAGGQGGGGGTCEPIEIPVPPEPAEHCIPDLQEPDCPVAAAHACEACLTGCVDFYACSADGWTPVAYCDERGDVVVAP